MVMELLQDSSYLLLSRDSIQQKRMRWLNTVLKYLKKQVLNYKIHQKKKKKKSVFPEDLLI